MTQRVTDHWPVETIIAIPEVKEKWFETGNSSLKGQRRASLSDEIGSVLAIISRLVTAEYIRW